MFLRFLPKASLKTLIISLGVLVLFIYSTGISLRNLLRYNIFKQELITSEAMLIEQEKINKAYNEEIQLMQTDHYWVLEAKKKLGYIQSGEYVYKFYSEKGM